MIMGWAERLRDSSLALYIQEDVTAFPLLEALHVMAVALVVGSIFIVDLRLMNLAAKSYPVSRLMRSVLPVTVGAFLLAAITGALMFASQPTRYLATTPFLIKLGLLSLALVNMGVFHLWTHRGIAGWDRAAVLPIGARMAGLISLILWIMILIAGRFVGFMLAY